MRYEQDDVHEEVPLIDRLSEKMRVNWHTLLLKADCGTGKTKAIMQWLEGIASKQASRGQEHRRGPVVWAVSHLKSIVAELCRRSKSCYLRMVKYDDVLEDKTSSPGSQAPRMSDQNIVTTQSLLGSLKKIHPSVQQEVVALVAKDTEETTSKVSDLQKWRL